MGEKRAKMKPVWGPKRGERKGESAEKNKLKRKNWAKSKRGMWGGARRGNEEGNERKWPFRGQDEKKKKRGRGVYANWTEWKRDQKKNKRGD